MITAPPSIFRKWQLNIMKYTMKEWRTTLELGIFLFTLLQKGKLSQAKLRRAFSSPVVPHISCIHHVTPLMTMTLKKHYVFLVSRTSLPLTQAQHRFIQGDLSQHVFRSQFFPFIIDKGSHLCIGRETGTVLLSDRCPQHSHHPNGC